MTKTLQFSKYGGVATGSAVTDYAVFAVLLVVGAGTLHAQMVARIAGGVFSFFANKYWSFGARKSETLKTEGRRFLFLYAFSYILSLAMLYLLTEQAGVRPYPAKIISDITCFLVNFMVMRNYVFGEMRGLRHGLSRFLGRG